MKLSILSRPNSIFSESSIKRALRIILGKSGGPAGVEESLRRGLEKINGIEYNFNPPVKKLYDTVVIIQGVDTLWYALKLKNIGLIKKIYAGPNITLLPTNSNLVLKNTGINKILVPSNWVKDMYVSSSPELKDKIEVWPAGVEKVNKISDRNNGFIIYYKNAPEELLEYIKSSLDKLNIKWNLLEYGKYKRKDYFNYLKRAKGAIFLSPSESQGLALQEAWIRNVPTLVWNSGIAKDKNLIWYSEKIGAPYLTDQAGIFFKNKEDFDKKIDIFLSKTFEPRKYCIENLTDEISTKKLLDIINKYEKSN